MPENPPREFGKRRPVVAATLPAAAPVKRSGHVALLLMGSVAIGGGAYTLMPRGNCAPGQPGMAAPGPQAGVACSPGGSSFGGVRGYWGGSSRYSFFGGDTSSSRPASGTSSETSSGVTRGGFGAFAQSISSHFSRGG
jgi:hypothetical protein